MMSRKSGLRTKLVCLTLLFPGILFMPFCLALRSLPVALEYLCLCVVVTTFMIRIANATRLFFCYTRLAKICSNPV